MKVDFTSIVYDNPLPQLRSRQAAFPFLCELDNGELICVYQIGEAFESVDGASFLSRSTFLALYGFFSFIVVFPLFHICRFNGTDCIKIICVLQ